MIDAWLLWANLICTLIVCYGSLYRIHECLHHTPPLRKALTFYILFLVFGTLGTIHYITQVVSR